MVEPFLTWLLTKGRFPYLAVLFLLTAGFSPSAFRIPVERNDDSQEMVARRENVANAFSTADPVRLIHRAETGHAEVKAAKRFAPLLEGAEDRIVRSAYVPSGVLPQGEVRLLRRGDAVVMQTVLQSRFLKRVVAEIRKKESASWPAEREGHADSLRYVDALMEATRRIQQRFRQRETRGERRQKLLIEFILSEKSALVALYEPDLGEEEGHPRVTAKLPVAVLELSRAYVRGDIYEIAWDALGLSKKESKKLLEPMLPSEPAGKEAQPEREGK